MTAVPAPLPITDPELYVEQWRILQYSHLGLSPNQIAVALVDEIDYHDAANLIKKGCDIDLALQILRT